MINHSREVEIKVIAETINTLCGNDKIEYVPKRKWDTIPRRWANIDKAKKLLGYDPKIKIDDGLKRTYDWFKEIME